jgi:hypothetical protein
MSYVELNAPKHSPIAGKIATALAYGVGGPLVKGLDAIGAYPRLARGLRRFSRGFRHILYPDIAAQRGFGDYQPTGHDVLVCAYPKSGTNWMLQMGYQIAFLGQGDFGHIHDVVPWPDAFMHTIPVTVRDESVAQASPTGLRVIKTHLVWDKVPYSPEARYIYVFRDPKDVLVSSYFHQRDLLLGPMMPSVKSWHASFLTKDAFVMGSWAAHVHGYWQVRDLENVFVVGFEQMKADQPAVIRQVAEFLGVELSPQAFTLVDEKSRFKYMKNVGHKFDPPPVVPWSSTSRMMLRKGESGASSELLTAQQQRQIDDYCRSALQEMGSDFPYDEWFVSA